MLARAAAQFRIISGSFRPRDTLTCHVMFFFFVFLFFRPVAFSTITTIGEEIAGVEYVAVLRALFRFQSWKGKTCENRSLHECHFPWEPWFIIGGMATSSQ